MSGGVEPGAAGGIQHTTGEPRQLVRSPEQVVLHLPVAGPASRMLAYAIDWFAIALLQLLLLTVLVLGFLSTEAFFDWFREPLAEALEGAETDPEAWLGSAFFYFGANLPRFRKVFGQFGRVIDPSQR